jgi:hypothetical protein
MYIQKTLITMAILFFIACGSDGAKDKHGESTPNPENADFSDTFVYKSSSKYKSVLIECAGATEENASCSLEILPFLGQEKEIPTKEMIMQRVVVSHDWMGKRFEEMLDLLDDDMKILLGAVTAIVIDDDIIPSYYWGGTGAMYIDPRYLWLNPTEAKTITIKDDFRSGFSNQLKFLEYSENSINGQRLRYTGYLDTNTTRSKEDIKISLARLLYHELAHANDFFPPHLRDQVSNSDSVLDAINSIFSQNISNKLNNTYPLNSEELLAMGKVMYEGKDATEAQKRTTATDMGTYFTQDAAAKNYAYSSAFEDTATLFEASMLKIHYNVDITYAFLEKPSKTKDLVCADYIVGWGVKNRIANETVKRRALLISKYIFPNLTTLESSFSNNLGTSTLLKTNISWCSSISQKSSSPANLKFHRDFIYLNDFKLTQPSRINEALLML